MHPLSRCLEELISFDSIAADREIWLSDNEVSLLKKSKGQAVIIYNDNNILAAGYYVPAMEIADEFAEVDPDFHTNETEVYIYSVVTHPAHRKRGLGTAIRQNLRRIAAEAGFVTAVTHVRHKRGWAVAGLDFYLPFEHRRVADYWEGETDADRDVEFMRFRLSDSA